MLPNKFSNKLFWLSGIIEVWPYPTPGDLDLNILELTLPAISGLMVFERTIFNFYLFIFLFINSYCDQTQSPRDHDLIKLKSSPPEVALTQVSNFLTKWF